MTYEQRSAAERDGELSRDSVGPALARRRAEKGLSLKEIGNKLKFAPRQLEALEASRFEVLPQGTFLRGMVRSYARLLELDPEPLLQAIAGSVDLPDADRLAARYSEPVPFSDPGKRLNLVYAVLSVAVLVVAGVVALEWQTSRTKQVGTPAQGAVAGSDGGPQTAAAPASAPSLAPPPAGDRAAAEKQPQPAPGAIAASIGADKRALPGSAKVLRFKFERESWVQVKDASGHVLMSQLNERGTESAVEGEPPFSLVIGNAQHVRVVYGDAPVDLMPHIKVEVARFTLP